MIQFSSINEPQTPSGGRIERGERREKWEGIYRDREIDRKILKEITILKNLMFS